MTESSLSIPGAEWERLRAHLLQNEVEQAAMLFASADVDAGGVQFAAREVELLEPCDFDCQSACHISLTDDARGRVIKRAWDLKLSMIELHSHVGRFASAAFSPSDWAGFAEFVPHVLWRLRGAPYSAIVVATDGFDGLTWSDEHGPVQLDRLIIGDKHLRPTGASIRQRYRS